MALPTIATIYSIFLHILSNRCEDASPVHPVRLSCSRCRECGPLTRASASPLRSGRCPFDRAVRVCSTAKPPLRSGHSPQLSAPADLQTHAERVRSRLAAWRGIGASRQVMTWLSEGVRVPWNERGPPRPFHHGVGSFSPGERAWLTVETARGCSTGAMRPARRRTHVSRAFVTYHRGKPRLVIDLRWVNLHTLARTCRFESLSSMRRML